MRRIVAFDHARGFTVLFIPVVHTVLLFSDPSVHGSAMGLLFQFIAEGPGAQLFMLLMGFYVSLNPPKSAGAVLNRAAGFFLAGCLLNFFKYGYWYQLGLLPEAMIREMALPEGADGFRRIFFTGDILHFAALAYPVLALVRRWRYHGWLAAGLALLVAVIAPVLYEEGFSYLNGSPPAVYFPLLPWIVYPLAGMALGGLSRCRWPAVGGALMALGLFLMIRGDEWARYDFYRTETGGTLLHLGFVIAWVCLWEILTRRLPENRFFRLLRFSSRQITLIYCIQWALIGSLIPLFGYKRLGMTSSVALMLTVEATVYALTFLILHLKPYIHVVRKSSGL